MPSRRRKSRAARASSGRGPAFTPPSAAARTCIRAARSMNTARNAASCTWRPAVRMPWFVSTIACFAPSAPAMISPSRSATGTPGHSGRNAQSSKSGVESMCATTSGCAAAASARAVGRVRVHDRVHVGPRAVHPEVEAGRRVRGAATLQRLQVVVRQHERRGRPPVEPEPERQGPVGAGLRAAGGDQAGEAGLHGRGSARIHAHAVSASRTSSGRGVADRAEMERNVVELQEVRGSRPWVRLFLRR